VTDANRRLLGIFTGRDAVGRVLAENKDSTTTLLAEVMTPNPRAVSPERSAIDGLRLMHDVGCRHVPIVEKDKVIGVVSRYDFRGLEVDRLDEETGLWERL
jgi:CBS domain-containing protein